MAPRYEAFLFDLNGTMINDMEFHVKAWYEVLNHELGACLSLEEVRDQMYGKNQEVLIRVFGENRFTPAEMDWLSVEKEKKYQKAYKPHLQFIRGLPEFLEETCRYNIKMAIGSAAIPFNIDFVLDRLKVRNYFQAIVSADDVKRSKPDPETFLKGAAQLGIDPARCLVFEDAPKGVEAAANAGMPAVVITTMHGREAFTDYKNIIGFISDYHHPLLKGLFPGVIQVTEKRLSD